MDPQKRRLTIDGTVYAFSELRVLACVAAATGELRQEVIVAECNLSKATVSQKLASLERRGLVESDLSRKAKYDSTSKVYRCADLDRAKALLTQVDPAILESD